jgi:hypothetical protein
LPLPLQVTDITGGQIQEIKRAADEAKEAADRAYMKTVTPNSDEDGEEDQYGEEDE